MRGRILVVGATGTVGGCLLRELAQRGEAVRGATRRPAAVSPELRPLAEWFELDFERPATFQPALAGVDRVFLVARPGDDHADRVGIPLVDEMARCGVERVVDLSALGAEQRDDFALRAIELHLERSGMAFTHLRPNWFMQIFSGGPLLAGIRADGVIAVPAADATISFVDVRDIAAVAARALCDPGHAGKAYALTGEEALDYAEVARLLSQASGRSIRYVALSEDEARARLRAAGFPPERVERLVGFYRLVRAGHSSPISPDMSAVLGRPALRFSAFARDHAAAWAA